MERYDKRIDVAALGELLIDFTEAGISSNGNRLFEQNPGGAPANLLSVLSNFGLKTEFIGKVGADMQGSFLKKILKKKGIGIRNLIEDKECYTTLAFVSIDEGERIFSFSRKPGADTRLRSEELNKDILAACRVFHFGSLSLTDEPAKTATYEAIKIAKSASAVISYDPNYRAPLWSSLQKAVAEITYAIKYVDIMKVSDEESLLMTGEKDYVSAAKRFLDMGVKLVAITLGEKGVMVVTDKEKCNVPGFRVKAVDTTGAGDSFWGGFISAFLSFEKRVDELTAEDIKKCAVTGNATAALCVTKRGGIPSVPSKAEVEELIKNYGL